MKYTNDQIKAVLAYGKKPFVRLSPEIKRPIKVNKFGRIAMKLPNQIGDLITQDDFLRELEPSSHKIFDKHIYPDKMIVEKFDDEGNPVDWRIEFIARTAIPFQRVIATKTKNHLTGKPLKFTLANQTTNESIDANFIKIKQTWLSKNMEIAFSECVESKETTGDCALYFFRENEVLDWETFSYAKGDVLLPRRDSLGRMTEFWRYFSTENEAGKPVEALMIIDNTHVYEYTKESKNRSEWIATGDPKAHGFSRLPVAYKDGKVAWNDVQGLIEEFEWAYSSFCESNHYFAFPILFTKGNVDALPRKGAQGKVLQGDDTAAANFISKGSSDADAFKYQFETMLNLIFFGSFTVNITPDTLKSSGDMPSSAIRLVMHPEIDKAIEGQKEWDDFLDTMKALFIEGIGLEFKNQSELKEVDFRIEIDIYIPENTSELIANLNNSVTMGSLSAQTASEKNTYATNDEYQRIEKESKAKLEAGAKEVEPNNKLNEHNAKKKIEKETAV